MMRIDTPLSAAIAEQLLEISNSASYPYTSSDFQLALRLLQEELQGLQQLEADSRLALNIRTSTDPEASPTEQFQAQDTSDSAQLREDRLIAERLARGEDIPSTRGLPARQTTTHNGRASPRAGKPRAVPTQVSPMKPSRSPKIKVESPLAGEIHITSPTPTQKAKKQPSHEVKVVKKRRIIDGRRVSPVIKKEPGVSEAQPQSFEEELSQLQDLLQVLATSIGWSQDWDDDGPSTSSTAASKPYQQELAVICTICSDTTQNYRMFSLECGHRYCVECMREHIMMTVNKKSSYPPRCCEPLPIAFATEVLQESELEILLNMRDLQASSKHISCAHCKGDILHDSIQDASAYCIACQKFTCTYCKKPLHDGFCPEDKDTTSLLETAGKEGWSRCEKCHHVVELSVGCHHITCRCGHQFCYLCEAKWKTCECPQSSESSVLGRMREMTGKGAEHFKQRWASPKTYIHDERQLDLYKTEAMESHRAKMDLRTSLQQIRAEKQDQRQIAEQIVLLRSEIKELQGQVDVVEMRKKNKDAEAQKRKVEAQEAAAVGEQLVGGILRNMQDRNCMASKKGKGRARDVKNNTESKEVLEKIMGYVRT